jgi:ubiquinone/menaquinone biosynthesis C-methylase UbiE
MTTQATPSSTKAMQTEDQISLLCWNCSAVLAASLYATPTTGTTYSCQHCKVTTGCEEGIWRCLSPIHADSYDRFIVEYEFIRAAEGRGSVDSAYYLALPFEDLSGKMSDQWKIRAQTFRHIERRVITPLALNHVRPLRILDLGAGNGWLSYRLALLGHTPVAVDLLTNDSDGLGAASHYASHLSTMFPRVQATLDQLPFADGTFDLAIFNASFHYSENYSQTLAETLRCTRRGGPVVIADTPWYADEESGRRMVAEKQTRFLATYGFASNSVASLEFLTPNRLQNMTSNLDIQWQMSKPFYGIDWALRPLRAKLRNRRPPSQFRVYVAKVKP